MELASRLITVIGTIIVVIGLSWTLTGLFDFLAGRKNGDPQRQDQGSIAIICGGALAAVAGAVAAAIVAQLGGLSF